MPLRALFRASQCRSVVLLFGVAQVAVGAGDPPRPTEPPAPAPPSPHTGAGKWGGVSGGGRIFVEASGCAHHVGNYDHRGDRCLQGGDNATVSPGSVGGYRVGVAGARGVGCWGGGAVCRGWIWGYRAIWGCTGSMHVSLCVGGGEGVGGWELISRSLVSMQSLDGSPCLAASFQPAPAPPLSYCGSPSAPEAPRCPPGTARAVARRVNQVRAGGERRRPSLGQGRVASVSHLRFPPHPGSCGGQEGLPTQPVKVRVSSPGSGEGSYSPNSRSRREQSQLSSRHPPTPTPTQPDPGSGPSGFSKLLGQPGAAAVLSSSRRSCP